MKRDTINNISLGTTFETTLITPSAPTAINGKTNTSSPDKIFISHNDFILITCSIDPLASFIAVILNGKSLEDFLSTFDTFLEILEMNEKEKELSRKMLMPVENNKNSEKKGFNVIDFTLLDEYFMRLYFNKS